MHRLHRHTVRNQASRIAELTVRRAPCDRGSPQGPQDERRAGNPPPEVLSAKLTPKNRNGRFPGHRWSDDLVSSSPSALEAARAGSPSPGRHLEQASRAAADFSGAGYERYVCCLRADSAQTWCARPRLLQVSEKSADTTGPCSRWHPTSSEPTNPSGKLSDFSDCVPCSQSW